MDNEESEGSGSEDDEEKKEEEKKTSKVYRPPKLAAVHYSMYSFTVIRPKKRNILFLEKSLQIFKVSRKADFLLSKHF